MASRARPRIVLLALFGQFMGTARLPASLQRAGAEVWAVCPPGSYLAATRYLDRCVPAPEGRPGQASLAAILFRVLAARPDLIVAMDEASLRILDRLRGRFGSALRTVAPDLAGVVRRSLPAQDRYEDATQRWPNQRLAESLGIPCPVSAAVDSEATVDKFIDRVGREIVLKADGTTAGTGVRVCNDRAEAKSALSEIRAKAPSSRIMAQQHIRGVPAMHSFSALNGQVLSGLSALKLTTHPGPTGPSASIEIVDHPEMAGAAAAMAAALGFGGFASFDFMVEAGSNRAFLIECNPRPTPICHLGNLAESLVTALAGRPVAEAPGLAAGTRLALYPQEWLRRRGVVDDPGLIPDFPDDDPMLTAKYESLLRSAR
jgi:hypothetical protein